MHGTFRQVPAKDTNVLSGNSGGFPVKLLPETSKYLRPTQCDTLRFSYNRGHPPPAANLLSPSPYGTQTVVNNDSEDTADNHTRPAF